MYVRLAFAVAAHLEPEILIVDEVLAVGDAAFQKKCLGKIGRVANEGRTVLFVSHNMASLAAICKTALVLESGVAVFHGPARDGIDRYLSSVSGRQSSVTYPVRPDSDVRFTSVSVLSARGESPDVFSVAAPIHIQIEYEVVQPVTRVQIVCHVWNVQRVHVFASADIDEQPELLGRRARGMYRAQLVVPGLLLAPGLYEIAVGCGVPNQQLMDEQGGPTFEVSAIDSYAVTWSGARQDVVLALPMAWRMVTLTDPTTPEEIRC
jgi:lipopolysaccharide transport system ATP-binding protein